MASRLLYTTNNPNMLRSLVGKEITDDFIQFCQQKFVTLDDILTDNYDQSIHKMDVSAKIATTVSASFVNENNFLKVRDFIKKLGDEMLSTFDSLWLEADIKRYEVYKTLCKSGKTQELTKEMTKI